jgi:hypothetical protein
MTMNATKTVEQLERENAILLEQISFLAGKRAAPLDNMAGHERMRKEREQAAHEARAKRAPDADKREQHRVSAMQIRKELGHIEGCDGSKPCFCSGIVAEDGTTHTGCGDYRRDFSEVSGIAAHVTSETKGNENE